MALITPRIFLRSFISCTWNPGTSISSSTRICTSITAGGTFGATRANWSRLFPALDTLIQRGEWDDAASPTERNRASYIEDFFAAAEAQTEFLDGDTEIVPGVRMEVGSGHTRCMQCVRVESGGRYGVSFRRISCPQVPILPYPWMTSFDLYPLETLANKKRLLPELAEATASLIFAHDPCSRGRASLARMDGRISTQPVE